MKKIYFPVFIFTFFSVFNLRAQVVINEVMITPLPDTCSVSMLDSAIGCGVQWIELYNPNPCQSVFLNYYSVGANTDPVNNFGTYTFWVGLSVIPPLGFLVIGANNAPYVDININNALPQEVCGSDPWSLNNGDGWVAIYDVGGNVIDAVYWTALPGNPGNLLINPEFANACCEPIVCAAPLLPAANTMLPGSEILYGGGLPAVGFSLARQQDGGSTWINNAIPTPGACNDTCFIPNVLSVSLTNTVSPSCTDSTGSISVAASNGTAPYSYQWNTNPAQFTSTASNLPSGSYTVTATDSYGCFAIVTTSLNPTGGLTATDTTNMVVTDESCLQNDGSITGIIINGGTAPYIIDWTFGGNSVGSSLDIFNLDSGNYILTVTDADSCPTVISVLVNPSPPLIANGTTTNETCSQANGTATVTPLNGTAPFTYAWSNGGNTQTITGLTAGVYVCTVTDANNCSQVITVTLTNTPAPVLTLSSTNISCFGDNNGTATAIASGGTAPITYLWSDGSITSSLNNLSAGNYSVTITDAGGCTATASTNITEPAAISITAGPDQTINAGEQASITSSGSAGIISYSWNPLTDCNSCQNTTASPTQTTTYTVTGMDASGCVVTDSLVVMIVLEGYVFVPDAFSPNGDLLNDLLFIRGADIATMRMIIHDRWGNQLFATDDMTEGWDGTYKRKEMNPGVYVYYVYGTFYNGTAFERKGDLTLIR